MNTLSWIIVLVPLLFVLGIAVYSRRYVRDVTDYLASGRVAGRYVLCVGDLSASLSVITLVAMCETSYLTGMAMSFWSMMTFPLGIFLALGGYCTYRFRETRCLSAGQFFELRYSRSFRVAACAIRAIAEMVTNAIGPAVAVRFFIYFIGLPHKFSVFGCEVSTYMIAVALLLSCALIIILPGGRISLLVTDCLQGMISYPIFVIFTVFVLTNISWFDDVAPVMLDRANGESFLNPMDVSGLRDFNMFAVFVTIVGSILNRAAFIGNDTTSSGRNAHEQKMAGILGTWKNGFSLTMVTLIGVFVITFMLGNRFSQESHEVRIKLTQKIADDVIKNKEIRVKTINAVNQLPISNHKIGEDKPYSRKMNADTPFLDAIHKTMLAENEDEGKANANFQQFRSLYNQMMMPVLLGSKFSPVLMGLFTLLMIMLLLSTDDSRIFNASSAIIQDLVIPFRKNPVSTEEHLKLLKIGSIGVTIFFFVVSIFFAQMDYIQMFCMIMCGLWMGASGPIMVGGLYSRGGTTGGAWSALAVGSGIPLSGLICQRNWADIIYPWLSQNGYTEPIGKFLEAVSSPFDPYIIWRMDAIKFPINSIEIYFIAMISGTIAYIIGSYLTYKEPFNIDRMFHRGAYSDNQTLIVGKTRFTFRGILNKLLGIDENYTKGDKVLAWSVMLWTIGYQFIIMFCGVIIWNMISPWPDHYWSIYFFITTILGALIVGSISTVWFTIGGIIDAKALFRDLANRVANPLDNGQVVGHVSLCDKDHFDEIDHEDEKDIDENDDDDDDVEPIDNEGMTTTSI